METGFWFAEAEDIARVGEWWHGIYGALVITFFGRGSKRIVNTLRGPACSMFEIGLDCGWMLIGTPAGMQVVQGILFGILQL